MHDLLYRVVYGEEITPVEITPAIIRFYQARDERGEPIEPVPERSDAVGMIDMASPS